MCSLIKDNIHMILEYSNWDLEMLIKDKSLVFMPGDIKAWMKMLLQGLDACHRRHIIHRDIKPNNT